MKRFHALLLVLCAASGCAALIYEVVWLQLLQLVVGATAVSVGVLLGAFMGGLGVGSLALARAVSERRHPLRVYALIESGIGVLGVAVLFSLPYLNRLYAAGAGHLPARAAVAAACLLPPTILMGASLPALARWVEATPQGISWLGFFYGANIAGAVGGCLLAGYYLLRVHDMATATYAAAGINAAVALAAFLAARTARHSVCPPLAEPPAPSAGARWAYVVIALSGLSALGAEVVWTRLLSLMLGPTVYTFSLILAVFLMGLGLGSAAGSWVLRRIASPRMALGLCQALLAAAIAWAAFALARVLPWWHAPDLLRCLAAVLPAACLWGASFPLALAGVARRAQDNGRAVGRVYAANTAGAIGGALAFSLLLIPAAGTRGSERLLIWLAAAAAVVAIAPRRRLASAATAAVLLALTVPATPWEVIAFGRRMPARAGQARLLYLAEGMNSSVAVSEYHGERLFHVSGKVEASSSAQDMRMQRMLGHLPALLHPRPRSALVVGCGAGVTAGSLVIQPGVERIVICEIEPLVPPAAARFFAPENYNVLLDGRTTVVSDDARHFLGTTRDSFDIITSDPIHPWVKGSATLYTREYFELVKRHLNPGGIVTQWVPLYESTPETVKSEIATFFEVFPNGTVWGNDTILEEGYDVVLLGQAGAARIDLDQLEERLRRPEYAAAARSLHQVGFPTALALLSSFACQARDLRPWLAGAEINRDRNLRLQYLAGMGLDAQRAGSIYDQLLRYRTWPGGLFAASAAREAALRRALRLPPK